MFIEAKDDGDGSGNWTTGAISRAKAATKAPVKSLPVHHQQTNIQFFYRPDALPVTHPIVSSTEGKNITFHGLAYHKLTLGSSNFVFDH